jgi:hypothetical protein
MSSHREAPEISKDPVADSTDVYAFVSPDDPSTVTLIANYIPIENPAGGPNFYEFGNDVLYEIFVDNNGDGFPDVTYQFKFETKFTSPGVPFYNTGVIESLASPNWNSKQFYSVTQVSSRGRKVLGTGLASPPCNIGPLSTPNYETALAQPAFHSLPGGITVFAGQRAEQFYVDLGSIFDLVDLRPLQSANVFAHALGLPNQPGINSTNHINVHTLAIQVPISTLTTKGQPTIGVWTGASRQKVTIRPELDDAAIHSGPWQQVSRLGNPLVNELLIPISQKDFWNTQVPAHDKQFAMSVANPTLAALLPVLYPSIGGGPAPFANLAAFNASGKPRADLAAILETGIPSGIIPGFTNFTGNTIADMLRLNTSIPPTPTSSPKFSTLGLVAGDPAGFPNGRRITDDVVTIELRAVAGLTIPLVDPAYKVDAVVAAVDDGLTGASVTNGPLASFPYMGVPYDGYSNPSS